MDLMNDAASSVQTAASTTYNSVSESLQSHCQTVATSLLNYKYQDRAILDTSPVYPDTLQPVWILGREWSAKHDLDELREIVQSRLWFTYRRDFPAIGSSEWRTDQGWGCMLRCGQMLLATCYMDLALARSWRWNADSWKDPLYSGILAKFQDKKSSPYSIHQIALMGESVENKPVGTWFGPNTVLQVLRKLTRMDPTNDLVIHIAMDNALILNEAKQSCMERVDETEEYRWKPLLLCISLRLGLTEINPVYVNGLKTCLSLPQTRGLLGGRPNHALYILGFVENQVIYLDPHITQPFVDLDNWHLLSSQLNQSEASLAETNQSATSKTTTMDQSEEENLLVNQSPADRSETTTISDSATNMETDSSNRLQFEDVSVAGQHVDLQELVEREDRSYHVTRPGRIEIDQLDPSLSLAFLCRTEEDFDNLCIELQEQLLSKEQTPLFEILSERPAHMYPHTPCDISVQPDESTGKDYEQVEQRKYDSEEEFEII